MEWQTLIYVAMMYFTNLTNSEAFKHWCCAGQKLGVQMRKKTNKTQTFRESLTPFRKVYYLYIYINMSVLT